MKLTISNGALYTDNLFFCYAEAGNGRDSLRPGRYPVSTQFSHAHGRELPLAQNMGWIGDDPIECDLVLGRVRKGDALLPCSAHVVRLLSLVDAAAERGAATTLVIE
jgi:hypothetical protein